MFVIGKPIAGGGPATAYGMSGEVAERTRALIAREDSDTGGIGGTLAANALSLAAMRATLEQVLTPEAYTRMISRAERFAAGIEAAIRERELPWIVKRLGCRVEYWFRATPPRTGAEAAAADGELDHYMHLAALNRGILMTPFHNMALIAPDTTDEDVDFNTRVFRECAAALLGESH
jgi:glutamate-1-semialdehyde 2,1-aminomutase